MNPRHARAFAPALLFGVIGVVGGSDLAEAGERARRATVRSSTAALPEVPRLELAPLPRPTWGLSELARSGNAVKPPRLDRRQLRREALTSAPRSAREGTLTRAGY